MKLNEAVFLFRDQKDDAENYTQTANDIAYITERGSHIRVETQTRLAAGRAGRRPAFGIRRCHGELPFEKTINERPAEIL